MRKILAGAIAVVCLSPVALRAEVVRFDIVERLPAFAGRSFGDVGPYERITARATIALNPSDDRNAVITDLAQAPRNPDGKVEATADVVILRPADPTHGNGTLLLEVPNRGRKLAPQLFDDSSQPGANNAQGPDDAGIGFLHRQGYTMVWVGWQGDIPSKPGQMALTAPALKGVTGPAREEFIFDTTTSPARATLTWPAADPANLTITVRAAIGHQMRSRGFDDIDFAGLQIHFLFRILQEQPHVAFQNVKSIGDVGVGVPRHLLGCRELQLRNAKARARGVLGTTLDFVKRTGVLDWLRLVHDGLPRIIRPHRVVMP